MHDDSLLALCMLDFPSSGQRRSGEAIEDVTVYAGRPTWLKIAVLLQHASEHDLQLHDAKGNCYTCMRTAPCVMLLRCQESAMCRFM